MRLAVYCSSLVVAVAMLAAACSSAADSVADVAPPTTVANQPTVSAAATVTVVVPTAAAAAPTVAAQEEAAAEAAIETGATAAQEAPAPVQFEASLAFLDEASERMAMTPHRFENFVGDEAANDAQLEEPTMAGVADGQWVSTLQGRPGESLSIDEPFISLISNGTDIYLAFTGPSPFPPLPEPISEGLAAGWILLNADEIEEQLGADEVPNLAPPTFVGEADVWASLRGALSIMEGPTSTSRGAQTRTIVAQVDPWWNSPDAAQDSDETVEERAISVVIHIDANGYVRGVTNGSARSEFFDFGADDLGIELPRDAPNLTSAWIEMIEGQSIESVLDRATAAAELAEQALAEAQEPLLAAEQELAAQEQALLAAQEQALLAAEEQLLAAEERARAAELDEEAPKPLGPTVPELLRAQPELSVFWSLLEASGLDGLFGDPNNQWTVLAPTNDGLGQLGEELDVIRDDPQRLERFVSRHLIPRRYSVDDLRIVGSVESLAGVDITIDSEASNAVLIDGVNVLFSDISSISGFVHVIPTAIG